MSTLSLTNLVIVISVGLAAIAVFLMWRKAVEPWKRLAARIAVIFVLLFVLGVVSALFSS